MLTNLETRLVMVVAQQPFEANLNQFCKLVPAVYLDGTTPDLNDFPNDGEIWWMLTPRTSPLANPGYLVVGNLEPSVGYEENDPTSSRYQAARDSVRSLEPKEGLEIINIPGDKLDNLQQIVSGAFSVELGHRPTPRVIIRWRAGIYGPFAVTPILDSDNPVGGAFTLAPSNSDLTVFKMDASELRTGLGDNLVSLATPVSHTDQPRSAYASLESIKHDLLLGPGYEKLLSRNPQKLLVEPAERKLNRLAKSALNRKKRQEFQQLLQEVELTARDLPEAQDLIQTLGSARQKVQAQEQALDATAKALLQAGFFGEDRLRRAELSFAERYVQERTAALQAQIERDISSKRDELRQLEHTLASLAQRIQKEEETRRAELNTQLVSARKENEEKIAEERKNLEKQKVELERQQLILQKNLEKVTKEFRETGDDVINRFLTIAPLIGLAKVGSGGQRSNEPGINHLAQPAKPAVHFTCPSFVSDNSTAPESPISESEFFQRFVRVVEDSGFVYRQLDLVRFHLSVKAGAITVLGGASGTGKSSLPLLYSRALSGSDLRNGRPDCLMVNVNPAWMEARDLLGHMNTLERRFYPGEAGLFHRLVYAEEEHKTKGKTTGMYLICLDEMNLSQVEHYFSDFMLVLERNGEQRIIQCFSEATAGVDCPFRAYGNIRLSPAVRFVGTVNIDETTRLLSDRFLDRTNLIELRPGSLPATSTSKGGELAKCAGRLVTLSDMEAWLGSEVLPPALAGLLDQMRPVLSELGSPISPRVYRGICKFVGSCNELIPATKAFDFQLAQRIVPRFRSLVSKRQLDALDKLLLLLQKSTVCEFDETVPLVEDARDKAIGRGWEAED